MIADLESHAAELRFLPGIKDVDIVPFPSGKELWVILSHPIELDKLQKASASSGCTVVKSGWLPSKLPRSLAEMVWDGVTYIVRKGRDGWQKLRFDSASGAVAKIVKDLVTGDTVYHVDQPDGLEILRQYLRS
jgi:hypothetical protein